MVSALRHWIEWPRRFAAHPEPSSTLVSRSVCCRSVRFFMRRSTFLRSARLIRLIPLSWYDTTASMPRGLGLIVAAFRPVSSQNKDLLNCPLSTLFERLSAPMAIIRSLLDTDFYKITMAQAVKHQWSDTWVRYRFKNRSVGDDLLPQISEVREEIDALGDLALTGEEYEYLRSIPFLKRSFVDGLRSFRLDPRLVEVREHEGALRITVEGNWYDAIWFEVPILAIVSEVRSRRQEDHRAEGRRRLEEKIASLHEFEATRQCASEDCEFRFLEFGTRRRYSQAWQEEVVETLAKEVPQFLQGTSNVDLARRYGIRPQGTMAHEWLQAHQALAPLHEFQRHALNNWLKEFRGSLGIALSDVVGMDQFLRDFDSLLAKGFDGVRQDSGDPFLWAEKLIDQYRLLSIDSRDKVAVFSDGLTFPLCFELWRRFRPEIKTVFGIGTNLTHDVGLEHPNIVLKLVEVNHFPVVKISDSPGKEMGESETYGRFLRELFRIG